MTTTGLLTNCCHCHSSLKSTHKQPIHYSLSVDGFWSVKKDCIQGLVQGCCVQICDCCENRLWQHALFKDAVREPGSSEQCFRAKIVVWEGSLEAELCIHNAERRTILYIYFINTAYLLLQVCVFQQFVCKCACLHTYVIISGCCTTAGQMISDVPHM